MGSAVLGGGVGICRFTIGPCGSIDGHVNFQPSLP